MGRDRKTMGLREEKAMLCRGWPTMQDPHRATRLSPTRRREYWASVGEGGGGGAALYRRPTPRPHAVDSPTAPDPSVP